MKKSPVLEMTHADYLSHPAYGSTDIITMGKSFARWKWKKTNPEDAGRPLVIGSSTHLMLQYKLMRTPLKSEIKVYKGGSSKTNGFKAFQEGNKGSYCLDEEENSLCERMVAALLEEPEVMGYLQGAIAEASVIGNYPGTSVLCKCRPDYLHQGRGVSINLKTAKDASESGFIYSSKDWGYDWQSAFYCDLLTEHLGKPFDEIHILVEKVEDTGPIPIKIFSFGDDTLAWARTQIRAILEKIPENEKAGDWPKAKVRLETVDLPLYARRLVNL